MLKLSCAVLWQEKLKVVRAARKNNMWKVGDLVTLAPEAALFDQLKPGVVARISEVRGRLIEVVEVATGLRRGTLYSKPGAQLFRNEDFVKADSEASAAAVSHSV